MDDGCCGRICVRQTVINQRDVKTSNEDLRDRIQFFDQQNCSPILQSFPASTSLKMATIDSPRQENAEAEVRKTCKRRWSSKVFCKHNTHIYVYVIHYCALSGRH